MNENEFYSELVRYVMDVCDLDVMNAGRVAAAFKPEDGVPSVDQIQGIAGDMGLFDHPVQTVNPLGAGVTMDEATIMTEVYATCPRVAMKYPPRMGATPMKFPMPEAITNLLATFPDEIAQAIVDINLLDGKAVIWVHDIANEVDRPIGPIDLTQYTTGSELREALFDLMRRINKVLRADLN